MIIPNSFKAMKNGTIVQNHVMLMLNLNSSDDYKCAYRQLKFLKVKAKQQVRFDCKFITLFNTNLRVKIESNTVTVLWIPEILLNMARCTTLIYIYIEPPRYRILHGTLILAADRIILSNLIIIIFFFCRQWPFAEVCGNKTFFLHDKE